MTDQVDAPQTRIALTHTKDDAEAFQETLNRFGIESTIILPPLERRGEADVEVWVRESDATRARWLLAEYPTFPTLSDMRGGFPPSGPMAVERARDRYMAERAPVPPSRIALVLLGIALASLLLVAVLVEAL